MTPRELMLQMEPSRYLSDPRKKMGPIPCLTPSLQSRNKVLKYNARLFDYVT
jgi:hypothetical protein